MTKHDTNTLQALHIFDDYGGCPKGGVTVLYGVQDGVIHFSVAKCHKDDAYSKKTGYQITLDRFINGNTFSIPLETAGVCRARYKELGFRGDRDKIKHLFYTMFVPGMV